MLCHLFISHVLTALYYSQLTRAALLMQEPDPWFKYSSRERNVIDTLAETETDTYMLIRSGGGGNYWINRWVCFHHISNCMSKYVLWYIVCNIIAF